HTGQLETGGRRDHRRLGLRRRREEAISGRVEITQALHSHRSPAAVGRRALGVSPAAFLGPAAALRSMSGSELSAYLWMTTLPPPRGVVGSAVSGAPGCVS